MTRHIPVLLHEAIKMLDLHKGGTAVDATLGGGGHTQAMLEQVLPGGRVIAFDADREAIERFLRLGEAIPVVREAIGNGSLSVIHGNFSEIGEALERLGIGKVDAVFADFGFSSDQVDDASRGFSFLSDGPLDMRLNREGLVTAADVVNGYAEADLFRIIRNLGGELKARKIAAAIIARRSESPLSSTSELSAIVSGCFSELERRAMRIHPATKTFQAIRMEVNDELGSIERLLRSVPGVIRPGGRLAVITFHSGEDALVKDVFREMARGCICPSSFPECVCGKKPLFRLLSPRFIRPSNDEIDWNPRARSAKLRGAERAE